MNVTLSVDRQVVERARGVARSMGKSLNQLIRDYLEHLTAQSDPERDMQELARLSLESGGRSAGWRFDRDELHERA
ncbi:MAG: MerR family transcriptional regulator [Gemmatimonadetes bacterium]|nr:MerR family transcriptional regulator [Gemmatimonadota bacterium]